MLRFMLVFSVAVVFSPQVGFSQTPTYSAKELARLADENWLSIESIDVTFTIEELPIAAKTRWLNYELRWIKKGDAERIVQKRSSAFERAMTAIGSLRGADNLEAFNAEYGSLASESPGRELDLFKDYYYDGEILLQLRGSCKELMSPPTSHFDAERRGFHGEYHTSLEAAGGFSNFAPVQENFFLSAPERRGVGGDSANSSLTAFLEGQEAMKTSSSVSADGDVIWEFEVPASNASYTIQINESKGFLVQSISNVVNLTSVAGTPISFVQYRRVNDYLEIDGDIYIPKEIEVGARNTAGSSRPISPVTFCTVNSVKINSASIDPAEGFGIPEYVTVDHLSSQPVPVDGGFFLPQSVWGADNKPKVTFNSVDERITYDRDEMAEIQEERRKNTDRGFRQSYWFRFILSVAGIVMLSTGVFFTWCRRRR